MLTRNAVPREVVFTCISTGFWYLLCFSKTDTDFRNGVEYYIRPEMENELKL